MSGLEFRAFHKGKIKNVLWLSLNHDELMFLNGINGYYRGRLKNCDLIQYTGLKDASGVKIFEGDILNICFTSGSGEYIHDGVYTVSESALGALEFDYRCLFWESHGYNQHPTSSKLCEQYGSLSIVYDKGRHLIAPDKYVSDIAKDRDFPFNNEKVLSFNSRYFKVIGNVYENPELLTTEDSL